MFRKRLATLAVVAGLGLGLGCSSMNTCGTPRTSLLSRLCGRCKTTTVAEGIPVVDTGAAFAPPCCNGSVMGQPCDGPLLMDRGGMETIPGGMFDGHGLMPTYPAPTVVPPTGVVPPTATPLPPGLTVPPLQQGRLTPTPQAQPTPFSP